MAVLSRNLRLQDHHSVIVLVKSARKFSIILNCSLELNGSDLKSIQ